ncbi:MAG TPA: YebC/PmpR family DNA-binding transcriptional regulator [Calditerricola sp.]
MAGHSKWKNIQHRKSRQDAIRGRLFTKLSKEIFVAARLGGGDPQNNPRLRMAIAKARAANMPNENIERTIKKALGELEGVTYEEITYEGYGPGGVAVMVNVLTDNRNRTASDMRYAFTKFGGNLGETGCVSYLFDKKGLLVIDKASTDADEDTVMLEALEAGASDFKTEDDAYQILTEPEDFERVKEALEAKGFTFSTAEVTMIPHTTVTLTGEDAARMLKLLDYLEEHDDVQNVYTNFDMDEAEMEKLSES